MRTVKVVVALVASVGLVAASLVGATTASAGSGTNSGGAAASSPDYVAGTHREAGCSTQILSPAGYPLGTVRSNLSNIADFTPVSGPLGKVKSFTPTMEKRSVPGSWATWGSPPHRTETATPHLLYSAGATAVTLTLKRKGSNTVGVEVEPNPFSVHTFTAVYTSRNGLRTCTITRSADGNAGARVLAATTPFKAKTVTISSDTDFGIAQIRTRVWF